MEIQWKSCRGPILFSVVMNWAKCQMFFFKELFDTIDTESETVESPSKDSEPKANETEPQTEPRKKRSSIVILDDEEIEEFQKKSRSRIQRKLSKELSAARRLQAWYNDRYGQKLQQTSNNKANAADLLKHFFLEIRDTRKDRLGE